MTTDRVSALIRILLCLFCLAAILALGPANAAFDDQSVAPIALRGGQPDQGSLRFERISIEQGLSESTVTSILQDSRGFMWFGTEDGLNRYDGYQFLVYERDPQAENTLSHDKVGAICEDRNGYLWIGTPNGLDRFDPWTETFVGYRHMPEGEEEQDWSAVQSIYEDRDGALWIATSGAGLDRFDPNQGTFTHYRRDPGDPTTISDDFVWTVFQDRQGYLWVGTFNGLNRFDPESETFTRYMRDPSDPHSLAHNSIRAIMEDSRGVLWVGTDGGGLAYLDRETDQFIQYRNESDNPYSLSDNRVWALLEDRAGGVWIGTANGLNRYNRDHDRFVQYRYSLEDPNSLSDNGILALYEDRSGVVWVGTALGGLSKYNRAMDQFGLYRHRPNSPNSLSDDIIYAIAQDPSGVVWVGTKYGGLNRLDRNQDTVTVYRANPERSSGLSSDEVRAVLRDFSGTIWIGTRYGGLNRFDPHWETFRHYHHDRDDPTSLSEDWISVLYQDHQGALWVGTWNGGLNVLDPVTGEFTRYQHDPEDAASLGSDNVRSIYEDQEGRLWVGTADSGISILDADRNGFDHLRFDPDNSDSLSSDDAVLSIHQDAQGTIWVGLYGGGLERFNPENQTFTHYSEQEGLADDRVYCIQSDQEGNLWISTNNGLSRFDPANEIFRNYYVQDGLQSNEFNHGACLRGSEGEMFFGGAHGFNSFWPEDVRDNLVAPPIAITSMSVLNQGERTYVPAGEQITLSYQDYFIAFEFAALDYTSSADNRYAYVMEGIDEGWVYAGTRRYASYTNLRGGDYVFWVKGSNNDGVWNDEGVAVYITVTPPAWETWWFRGILILGLVVVVPGGYLLRIRGAEARSRELESQVRQRTHDIEQRTQELEALYRADERLHRHLNLDQVLQTLVDIAVDVLKADKSALMTWDSNRERLVTRVARGFAPTTVAQMNFAPGEGSVGQAAALGEAIVVEDVVGDHRWEGAEDVMSMAAEAEGISSCICIPVIVSQDVFGVFNVSFTAPRGFAKDEKRLFVSLTKRAAMAIENAQLYEQAQHAAILEERQRLARDLHDAVTQTLFSASIIAEVLPSIWEMDPAEGKQLLRELRQLSRGALAEMRTLLLELRPTALAEARLPELLSQLAEAAGGWTGVPVEVNSAEDCELPPAVHVAMYRIAQEALNNVVKHARASQVKVRLSCDSGPEGKVVKLCVSDDGCGFDQSLVPPDHMGLEIMRERSRAIGGDLQIESEQGSGTCVTIVWHQDQG